MFRRTRTIEVFTRQSLFCIAIMFLQGCAGTFRTRENPDYCGAILFEACVDDMNQSIDPDGEDPIFDRVAGVFSMPLDLCLDVFCLPSDAIWWVCGKYEPEDSSQSSVSDPAAEPPRMGRNQRAFPPRNERQP